MYTCIVYVYKVSIRQIFFREARRRRGVAPGTARRVPRARIDSGEPYRTPLPGEVFFQGNSPSASRVEETQIEETRGDANVAMRVKPVFIVI